MGKLVSIAYHLQTEWISGDWNHYNSVFFTIPLLHLPGSSRDLARNEEFSEIAVINIFLQFSTKKPVICGGGSCGENFEISHAIDM